MLTCTDECNFVIHTTTTIIITIGIGGEALEWMISMDA